MSSFSSMELFYIDCYWFETSMRYLNIKFIVFSFALFCSSFALGQEESNNTDATADANKPTKYVAVEEQEKKLVFFQGFTLSADLFGPLSYVISDYGSIEAALRLNLKNTYLPIVEIGYGKVENFDLNTNVSYKTNAPFARIGVDYNMLKDKFQSNRLYAGVRYGISSFSYDIAGPEMTDPIWGGSEPFDFKGIDCTSQWGEIVFGAEVQVYKNLHMGWLLRYKKELSSTKSDYAKPNCIPGYGYTTNSTCWGATYSLIFDLNWGLKKSHKGGVNVEVRDINNEDVKEDNTDSGNGTEQ